jgi:hypothetical protein
VKGISVDGMPCVRALVSILSESVLTNDDIQAARSNRNQSSEMALYYTFVPKRPANNQGSDMRVCEISVKLHRCYYNEINGGDAY